MLVSGSRASPEPVRGFRPSPQVASVRSPLDFIPARGRFTFDASDKDARKRSWSCWIRATDAVSGSLSARRCPYIQR